MPAAKKPDQPRRRPPATTPEARVNQVIALAVNLAEKQISEGTASSQVLTHFLKLATEQATLELERERLAHEVILLKAKTEAIQSSKKNEELYSKALNAMRTYSGREDRDD